MMKRCAPAVVAFLACAVGAAGAADMVLVDKGVSKAPIIIAEGLSPETIRAANTLAGYIEKISGAKPAILTGAPEQVPSSAIWVGLQPKAAERFKGANLALEKPEEILILCDGQHILLAGRDVKRGEAQIEQGTANAVYTFIEKQLDVRWLWPGPLGEDFTRRETITVAPVEYRFNPHFLQRTIYRRAGGPLLDWNRFQRNQLDSFRTEMGHAFSKWWVKYSKDHPDYFALQPDGSRDGYPAPGTVKLCETNPKVWAQWLVEVEEQIKSNPAERIFNAAPNDSSSSGLCVCDECRKWDNLEGPRYRLGWRGLSQEYVAMTDRYVKFWNVLGRGLKERYPGEGYFVSGFAYGPAKPPPVDAKLEDNVLIAYVGHFPFAGNSAREREKAEWAQWAEKAPRLMFRPNVFWYSGGMHGIPTLALRNTMEDFRFLAERNGVGLALDMVPQHWATQGPQYYLFVQLAWDPMQDAQALMQEYYRRGFGPASAEVQQYFDLMEEGHMQVLNSPSWRNSMGIIKNPLTDLVLNAYNAERMARAEALLRQAEEKATGSDIHRQRVAFVRTGLEFTQNVLESLRVMTAVRQSSGRDVDAVKRAIALTEAREDLFKRYNGIALSRHQFLITWVRARAMQDYVGPPSELYLQAAGIIEGGTTQADAAPRPAATPAGEFKFVPAEQAGWKLAFSDDFRRDTLGEDWQPLEGAWRTQNGELVTGGGMLMCARSFPGLQRLEFEAVTNVKPFPFFGPDTQASVQYSDLSSLIHCGPKGLYTGYFMQFGGFLNTRNRIVRMRDMMAEDTSYLITPGQTHRIVAEFDGQNVRLIVDERLLVEYSEAKPLVGPEHERIGFYITTGAKIRNVRIYTKTP